MPRKERACHQKGILAHEKGANRALEKVDSGQVLYEPIKNSGLFEKLLYLGRNRSVSY